MSIERGYRDRATAVAYTDAVDPVTRRPIRTPTYPAGPDPFPCRIVHRTDRSVVRDPDNPTRVLVDADILLDPEHAEALPVGVDLHTVDGRRYLVTGGPARLTARRGDAVYARLPVVRSGRAPTPPDDPEPAP